MFGVGRRGKLKKTFYHQEHVATCGLAVLRTVLKNQFDIKVTESQLVKLAEAIYEIKHPKAKGKRYKIKKNGTDLYHFYNLAEFFGLKVVLRHRGNANQIKYLIRKHIWPIIHRPYEKDGDGHYVVVHGYDEKHIHVFDPMRKTGGLKKEKREEFLRKWRYADEKFFLALAEQEKIVLTHP